ncbi:rho GTPase-activating protein 21 isoform X2 [Astyanax mexicanus]|uniref:rho GTPase-activating protein 21 isoform X2 n=1 Tax=Astyanax mexicanus TaxID=7994 RepID=UPI0020CB380B|nr:rho GTPase-activating protein 21 isoform X2 [Astyanax mexicanus]
MSGASPACVLSHSERCLKPDSDRSVGECPWVCVSGADGCVSCVWLQLLTAAHWGCEGGVHWNTLRGSSRRSCEQIRGKQKDGCDHTESCLVSPGTEEPFSWPGPKTLRLRRNSQGFGFTLRHFIVYPPESAVHYSLKDEDNGSRGRQRNRLEPMDTIFVKQVKEGGPAHGAGLCTGDRIVKVNGESIIGKTYSQVIALIQNSDASLELCVMPKDEDILQLFSRDITALAYSQDAYLKGNEAYSGNARNIPEPPPICYPRIECKVSGMTQAQTSDPPAHPETSLTAGRRSNPEINYRVEIPVPPSPPSSSQVSKTVVCVYNETGRTTVEPVEPSARSTPSHRTEEDRYAPLTPATTESASERPRAHTTASASTAGGSQLHHTPGRVSVPAVYAGSAPVLTQSLRPPATSTPASSPYTPSPPSSTTSPCSPHQNIDWRNYTTYKEYIDNKRLYMYGCRTIQERLDSLRAAAGEYSKQQQQQREQQQEEEEPGKGANGAQIRRRSASHERSHIGTRVPLPLRSVSQEKLGGGERGTSSRDWPRSVSQDALPLVPVGVNKPRARSCDYLSRHGDSGTDRLLQDRRTYGRTETEDRGRGCSGDTDARGSRQSGSLRTVSHPHRPPSTGYGGSYPGLSVTPLLSKVLSSRAESLGNTATPKPSPLSTPSSVPADTSPASYVSSALASLHAAAATGSISGSSRGAFPELSKDQRAAAPVPNHVPPGAHPSTITRARTESLQEPAGSGGLGVRPQKTQWTQQSRDLPMCRSFDASVLQRPVIRRQQCRAGGREGVGIEGADATVVVLRRDKSGPPPLRHPSYIQAVNDGERGGDTPTCWLPNDARRDMSIQRLGDQHQGSAELGDSLDSIPFIDEPSSPSVDHDNTHIPASAVICSTPVITTIPPSPTSPTAIIRRQLSHDQDSLRLTILESDSGTKTERSKSCDEGLDNFREEGRGRSLKHLPGLRGLRKAVDRSSEDSGSRRDSSSDVFSDATKEGLLHFRQLNSDKGKRVGSKPWKQMYAVLQGHSLFLYKDKKEAQTHASSQTEDEPLPISIRACLIDISYSDTKRKNVLRLTTSDCEYLFQAEDREDMLSWIRAIQENGNLDEENALITSTDLINRKIKEYNTMMSPPSSKTEQSPKASRQSLSIRHTLLGGKGESKSQSPHSPNKEYDRKTIHKDESSPPKDKRRKGIPGLMRKPFEKKASPGVTFGVRLDDCPPAHTNRFVPLIVEVCCKLVEERGLEYTGIYRVPGNNAAISSMQEELNKGVGDIDVEEDKWKDLNVISSLLKSFFRKLPEPLFTNEKYSDFIDANRTEDPVERLKVLKRLLHELPDHHYETLKFLSAHLKTVAENSEKNKMEPRNLAIVFGPTLVRTSDDNMTHMVTHMPDQYKIVETLIQHYDWFFTEEGDEEPVTTVQQDSAVETQPVPNIDHLLTNIGRTGTSPGEVSDSPTSDSAKSKGSLGSGKDPCSRELVSSIFAAANRKRKKHKEKLQPSSSDDDLDAVFSKKELPVQGQEAAEGDGSPVPAGAKHRGNEEAATTTTPKSQKEYRNSFFMRDKSLSTSSKYSSSTSPNLTCRTVSLPKGSLSDTPSQVDEATSDLGTMSSGASVPRSRPRRWGTATPSAMELSPAGPTGASATAEVSSITSDYSTTSSNTFLTGAESSALSPEVQSMTESRAGDEADDERSELISEGRPMETDSESDFPVYTSRDGATPSGLELSHALFTTPCKTDPSTAREKPDCRRLLPSHRLIECDSLSRRRSLRQKTDSESSVEGAGAGAGTSAGTSTQGVTRSEPNRLSRVLEAMKKGRSTGSLSSSSSRSESDRTETTPRRLKITERLKCRLRLSADDMFGIGDRKNRTPEESKKKNIRRRHTMGGQRDFGELAVINDWREQGGGDQGAELPVSDRLKPQEVSFRDWLAGERWKAGGSRRASKEAERLVVSSGPEVIRSGAGEELSHHGSSSVLLVSSPSPQSPQSSTEQVNGGGPQGKSKASLNSGADSHPHKLSGAQVVRSRFYQCL